MKRHIAGLLSAIIVLTLAAGCAPAVQSGAVQPDSSSPAPVAVAAVTAADEPNFVLLISDEPNDIEDFSELWVTISGIGFVMGDEEGIIQQSFEPVDVPLTDLIGDAAIALWTGELPEGDYVKIFIYVDEVWGTLVAPEGEEAEVVEIKLPSNKLQLDMPFDVGEEETTEFVFDISVFKAGNSGQYILKPQLTESGQGQLYRINEMAHERVQLGRPDWAGKPEWAAQGGEKQSGSENANQNSAAAGKPAWTDEEDGGDNKPAPGRPDEGVGRPEGAGRPSDDEPDGDGDETSS